MKNPIPVVTQYASPSLIADISYGGHARTDDPRWRESGAPDLGQYAEWSVRWCGMACLRMVLLARDGHAPSLYELTMDACRFGAYSNAAGGPEGLIYAPFVRFVADVHGLRAEVVTGIASRDLLEHLHDGRLAVASVHPEIRRPHRAVSGVGGHLVLATGCTADTITFHDPAGHTPQSRVATLPIEAFEAFFAGRGIVIHP